MRAATLVVAIVLVGFGLATLHYVNFDDVEHHREWALDKGLPPPSLGLGVLGVVATAVGAFLVGCIWGSRSAARRADD